MMLRFTSDTQRQGLVLPEYSRLLFGLALLLAILSDGVVNQHFTALSTIITANRDPSALQQLATFASMEDVAEEEQLDWGSSGHLVRGQPPKVVKPRNASTPDAEEAPSASAQPHQGSRSLGADSDGPIESTAGLSSATSSASSSLPRRRPHRRHRRRNGAASRTDSSGTGAGASSSRPMHAYSMWTQLHVMEVAYSTGDNNFVHITERFVQMRQIFSTIYRCDLSKVACPSEAELLAAPSIGLASSSRWTCLHCAHRHDAVREMCLRCRAPSRFAKIFVGQAIKELDCTQSLVRFFYATHPDVVIHRAEGHYQSHESHDGTVERGKGCATLYVYRDEAAMLIQKLHNNAFFDVDDVTGELGVYYVYKEQQEWLKSFVAHRKAAPERRPRFLPLAPLVVEESASSIAVSPKTGRAAQAPPHREGYPCAIAQGGAPTVEKVPHVRGITVKGRGVAGKEEADAC